MNGNLRTINLDTANQDALNAFVKNGGSLSIICSETKCTEDHVYDRIMRICDTASIASDIFSRLKENNKFHRQSDKGRKGKGKHDSKKAGKRDIAPVKKAKLAAPETHAEKLAKLRTEEEHLSDDVARAEAEVVKYQHDHIETQQAIAEVQVELERHIKEIAALREKFDGLEAADKEAVEKREAATATKNDLAEKLESIRAKIAQLDKVTIRVTNETIEVSSKEFTADAEEKERIFNRIVKMKACDDLRVRDIRRMAELFSLLHGIDRKTELSFEDHEFENAYYAIYAKGVV